MLNVFEYSYIKRAIKIFIISTILLLITIILAFIFHPSEELLKQLGNKSPKRVSETHGLLKVWGFILTNGFLCANSNVYISLNSHSLPLHT